mmetsp:Transcript_43437/g.134237  ORF Transcript_43437/g.134237 Transcript_43437/m.134237 type:complete len:208 (-) Transcript_43437:23-646(-)
MFALLPRHPSLALAFAGILGAAGTVGRLQNHALTFGVPLEVLELVELHVVLEPPDVVVRVVVEDQLHVVLLGLEDGTQLLALPLARGPTLDRHHVDGLVRLEEPPAHVDGLLRLALPARLPALCLLGGAAHKDVLVEDVALFARAVEAPMLVGDLDCFEEKAVRTGPEDDGGAVLTREGAAAGHFAGNLRGRAASVYAKMAPTCTQA